MSFGAASRSVLGSAPSPAHGEGRAACRVAAVRLPPVPPSFSITGRVESRFGFLVPFKRCVLVLSQGWGWGKFPSQGFPGPPTHAVPCQGTGEAGPANQPASGITGSRSHSLGNARPSRSPDSFAGTGVYPDPACIRGFALSALVLVPHGAALCLAAPGNAAGRCRVSLCGLVAGAGLGTGVPWAAFVPGLGASVLPMKGLAAAGRLAQCGDPLSGYFRL